jgi:hypothetical protein
VPDGRDAAAPEIHHFDVDAGRADAVMGALDRRALAGFWNETLSPVPVERTLERASTAVEPTASILPPAVRGGRLAAPARLRRTVVRATVRLAVEAGDERDRRLASLVRAELAPIGVDVTPVTVEDKAAAMRDPAARIDLAALGTELDYPDPASFLARMLGRDVPSSWLPARVVAAVARLGTLTGAARDQAALALAGGDLPVLAYGTPTVGALLGARLGCRIWNGVDAALDLAALCLSRG